MLLSPHPAKLYPVLVGIVLERVKSLKYHFVWLDGAPVPPFASNETVYDFSIYRTTLTELAEVIVPEITEDDGVYPVIVGEVMV